MRGVSKDRRRALVAHPSRLAVKNGEHLRMTAKLVWHPKMAEPAHDEQVLA